MSTLLEDAFDLAQAGAELRDQERERLERAALVNAFFDERFAEARALEEKQENVK